MELVRLVLHGKIIEEREMHRAPMKGEIIWVGARGNEDLYEVREVHWRPDGRASLLLHQPTPEEMMSR